MAFADLVETNPPLIIWMSALPVLVGKALGISLPTALQGCLMALAMVSIAWSTGLIRRGCGSLFAGCFLPLLVYALVVHPWPHSGQREHIMLFLVLPYLVMTANRLTGLAPSMPGSLAAGVLAGLGILLKPHDLIAIAAIETLLLFRKRDLHLLVRPELLAMALTGVSYVVAILLWAPDYLSKTLPMLLGTYYDYHRAALSEIISPGRFLKMALVVAALLVMRHRLRHRALAAILLLAGIGTTIGCIAQLKAHESHFVPALAFFTLLFGAIVIDSWLKGAATRLPLLTMRTAGLATASALVAVLTFYPLQLTRASQPYTDARIAVQRNLSDDIPTGSTVFILSTATESHFSNKYWTAAGTGDRGFSACG